MDMTGWLEYFVDGLTTHRDLKARPWWTWGCWFRRDRPTNSFTG